MKNLENSRIIKVDGQPSEFTAIPFDEALNTLIRNKKKNAKKIENNKKILLSNWQTFMQKNSEKNQC
jgi:hypothetical protein